MKKVLWLSLSVLLLPVAMQAQTIHTTGGAVGYVPEYHGNPNKVAEKVEGAVGGFLEGCAHCVSGAAHFHTTGGAVGYVPPVSFQTALERANANAAQKSQATQATQESAPWELFYIPAQKYGFCWGIYDALHETPQEVDSLQGKAALQFCTELVDSLAVSENSCPASDRPTSQVMEDAREEGKNWWKENVVESYVEGYNHVAQSYMAQAEATHQATQNLTAICEAAAQDYVEGYNHVAQSYMAQADAVHQTNQKIGAWCRKHIINNYKEGYRNLGASYMAQSAASHKTLVELGNFFVRKWKNFSNWLCGE